jgi:hypothetical protein
MTIPKEYEHSWEYTFQHLFTPLQRYSMYFAMFFWAVWGISGFALLTTNATLQGVAFAKEVWAEYQNPDTTYEKTIVVTEKDPIKVLEVVAQCESEKRQYHKNGTLVIGINTNKTIDVGYYQINSANEAVARANGWDIYTEDGNRKMAHYMYEKEGLKPWNSSRHCWENKI